MRAVVYSRVSTDAQERDGTSLDTQERACIEFAEAKGWSVGGTIRDAASGFSLERAGLSEVRDLAKHGMITIALPSQHRQVHRTPRSLSASAG